MKIVSFMHVGIGLALKSDVAVGSASHHETRQPLNDIPEIEADKQGFLHLAGVYALMKYEVGSKPCLRPTHYNAHEVHGFKALEWQKSIANNNHIADKVNENKGMPGP